VKPGALLLAYLCLFSLHHSHAGVCGSQINPDDSASDRLRTEKQPGSSDMRSRTFIIYHRPANIILTHTDVWLKTGEFVESTHSNKPDKNETQNGSFTKISKLKHKIERKSLYEMLYRVQLVPQDYSIAQVWPCGHVEENHVDYSTCT